MNAYASGNKEAITEWQALSEEGKQAMVRRVGHQAKRGRAEWHAIAIWGGSLVVILLNMEFVPQDTVWFDAIFIAAIAASMYGVFVRWRQFWRENEGI